MFYNSFDQWIMNKSMPEGNPETCASLRAKSDYSSDWGWASPSSFFHHAVGARRKQNWGNTAGNARSAAAQSCVHPCGSYTSSSLAKWQVTGSQGVNKFQSFHNSAAFLSDLSQHHEPAHLSRPQRGNAIFPGATPKTSPAAPEAAAATLEHAHGRAPSPRQRHSQRDFSAAATPSSTGTAVSAAGIS